MVEVTVDYGFDFTFGEFPEGFRAMDLARKLGDLVEGTVMIRITTPRIRKDSHVYLYNFWLIRDGHKWGYICEVSEEILQYRGSALRPGEEPAADLDAAAAVIASEVNREVDKFMKEVIK